MRPLRRTGWKPVLRRGFRSKGTDGHRGALQGCVQGSFALSGASILGPAFGFVGQPVDRLFDPIAMRFDRLFVEFAGDRQPGSKDHARARSGHWDGESIPGRRAVGPVVTDADGDDGDLE